MIDVVLGRACGLFLISLATRTAIWAEWVPPSSAWVALRRGLSTTGDDVSILALFGAIGIVAGLGAQAGPARRVVSSLIAAGYWLLGLTMAVNVIAISILGMPILKGLLVNADWFRSHTPLTSLAGALTPRSITGLVVAGAALGLLPAPLSRLSARLRAHRAGPAGMVVAGLAMAMWYVHLPSLPSSTRERHRTINPARALIASLLLGPNIDLLAQPARGTVEGEIKPGIALRPGPVPRGAVIVVMESVGADVAYGESRCKRPGLMPNLAALAMGGVRLDNVVTVAPASTASAIALLSGRYPGYPPRAPAELVGSASLPRALAGQGFATAYFSSGDLSYQHLSDYIGPQAFSRVVDMIGSGCAGSALQIDDSCLVPALDKWLAGLGDQRFLAVLWTDQTHYPYYTAASPHGGGTLAAYEQAVGETDAMLGKLIDMLRQRGRLDDTILVVLGDHGEAFGEHGYQLHANSVFREEIRVPLVLHGGPLPAGLRSDRSGSTIDIAATVLGLLKPDQFSFGQGESLLAPGPERVAFSSALGADPMVGSLRGNRARILSLVGGQIDEYDLARDPMERYPRRLAGQELADAMGQFAALARQAAARDQVQ